MSRKGLNGFLLVLLLICIVTILAMKRDVSEPNKQFIMTEMVHSVPFDAFASMGRNGGFTGSST